jgi:hypothetical protein
MNVTCKACGSTNEFLQPHPYHAGFGNRGFLYNEAGTLTLVWRSRDPVYVSVVGPHQPWMLSAQQRSALEERLSPAPSGGRWGFSNPPRCMTCGTPIGEPASETVYYFIYAGSIVADGEHTGPDFGSVLRGQ